MKRPGTIKYLSISLYLVLVCLFLLLVCSGLSEAQYTIEKIEDNGNDANRLVWVIMGDGYTSFEMDDYHSDVERVVTEFFNLSPWKEYRQFVNIYRIDVVSNDSGADHPSNNSYVDTALDGTYDTHGITRFLTVDDSKAFEIALQVPSVDAVMVIVNDEASGGSGGAIMVLANHEKAGRMALHEAGHLIGGLADEYETPYPGYPDGDNEPNVTFQKDYEHIPWNNWIEKATPLPTPDYGIEYEVGLYEGARYKSTGIYRPTYTSIMRSLSAPSYGPINEESLIINLHEYVDIIDHYLPDKSTLFTSGLTKDLVFKIELLTTEGEPMDVIWKVDTLVQEAANKTTFKLDPSTIEKGIHTVTISVKDGTSRVKNDPQGMLSSTRTWSFQKDQPSGALEGKVINSINGYGIKGILIETEGGEYNTITEEDGTFNLSPIPENVYTITAYSENYSEATKYDIAVIDGTRISLTIELDPLFDTYSVKGSVLGDVLEGVTIDLNKDNNFIMSTETGVDGAYIFKGLESGLYTVIPNYENTLFNPPYHTIRIEDDNYESIDFYGITLLCPARFLFGSKSPFLGILRKFRNSVLEKSELGRYYKDFYYTYESELTKIISKHDEIQLEAKALLVKSIPTLKSLSEGDSVLLRDNFIRQVYAFIDMLCLYASPELERDLRVIRNTINKGTLRKNFKVNMQ
jgi:hypothetical protein